MMKNTGIAKLKVRNHMIPLSEPVIRGNEWKYIKDSLDIGWVSSAGDYITKFEDMVADYLGANYAIATVNGTSALHVSLLACGVKDTDEVIVPTLTFIAPVNTVRYCGAKPIFMDCDPNALCLDTLKTLDFINKNTILKKDGFTYNRATGNRIKAIIPVHIFGHPADMDSLLGFCRARNIDVIEDATESLGSLYKNKRLGSLGRAGCLSFNGNKIITTGGGGMVVTQDRAIAGLIRHLTTQAKVEGMEYDHDAIGYNYRLTNIQAAFGVGQMERLDYCINVKRKNASFYRKLLSKLKGQVDFLWEEPWAKSNFWFYTIKVPRRLKNGLIQYLLARNIQVRPIWKLIHKLPMYRDCASYKIKNARKAYETCINLPCSVNLKESEIGYIVKNIEKFFRNYRAKR